MNLIYQYMYNDKYLFSFNISPPHPHRQPHGIPLPSSLCKTQVLLLRKKWSDTVFMNLFKSYSAGICIEYVFVKYSVCVEESDGEGD